MCVNTDKKFFWESLLAGTHTGILIQKHLGLVHSCVWWYTNTFFLNYSVSLTLIKEMWSTGTQNGYPNSQRKELTMTWCWEFSHLYVQALIISWFCFTPVLFALIVSRTSGSICNFPCAIFSILSTSILDATSWMCWFVNFPSAAIFNFN